MPRIYKKQLLEVVGYFNHIDLSKIVAHDSRGGLGVIVHTPKPKKKTKDITKQEIEEFNARKLKTIAKLELSEYRMSQIEEILTKFKVNF